MQNSLLHVISSIQYKRDISDKAIKDLSKDHIIVTRKTI